MRRGTVTQTHRRPWPLYISPRLRLTQSVISKVNESNKWQYQSYTINLPAAVTLGGAYTDGSGDCPVGLEGHVGGRLASGATA